MMKKSYQEPAMEVMILSAVDLITTSGGFPGDEDWLLTLE